MAETGYFNHLSIILSRFFGGCFHAILIASLAVETDSGWWKTEVRSQLVTHCYMTLHSLGGHLCDSCDNKYTKDQCHTFVILFESWFSSKTQICVYLFKVARPLYNLSMCNYRSTFISQLTDICNKDWYWISLSGKLHPRTLIPHDWIDMVEWLDTGNSTDSRSYPSQDFYCLEVSMFQTDSSQ